MSISPITRRATASLLCSARARVTALVGAVALLAGCANMLGPTRLPPGTPYETVVQQLGSPTAIYPMPDNARRLEYFYGPWAKHKYMVDVDANGRLLKAEQVLTENRFNAITPGMSRDEVLRSIGVPAHTYRISRQKQVVWAYRFDGPFCLWFQVGLGEADHRVVDWAYGPDPLCDDDRPGHRL